MPSAADLAAFKTQILPSLIDKHIDELKRAKNYGFSTQSPGMSTVAQGLHALMQIDRMIPAPGSSGSSGGASGNNSAPATRR